MGGTLLVWPEGVGAVKIGCEFFISWSLVYLKVGLQFHYSEVLSVEIALMVLNFDVLTVDYYYDISSLR